MREHRVNAGHGDRLGDVDRKDPGVRMRAAHGVPPQHPRDDQVAAFRAGGHQGQPGGGLGLPVGGAHQADVAVQVHRLVGLVGEIDVSLALERGDVRPKSSGQSSVGDRDVVRGRKRPDGTRRQTLRFFEAPPAWSVEGELHEELVDMVDERVPARLPFEPAADLTIEGRQLAELVT